MADTWRTGPARGHGDGMTGQGKTYSFPPETEIRLLWWCIHEPAQALEWMGSVLYPRNFQFPATRAVLCALAMSETLLEAYHSTPSWAQELIMMLVHLEAGWDEDDAGSGHHTAPLVAFCEGRR